MVSSRIGGSVIETRFDPQVATGSSSIGGLPKGVVGGLVGLGLKLI